MAVGASVRIIILYACAPVRKSDLEDQSEADDSINLSRPVPANLLIGVWHVQ